VRSATCRIVESSKVKFKFDDVTATKLSIHPLFSGCTNWPRLKKGKGKKRAVVEPAASVATAAGLWGEEGSAFPAKQPNSSLLEETVYAMGALAGDPRANAHYMELHSESVARRATFMCFCARTQLRRVRVDCICKNFMHYDLRSRHVCSLQSAVVQLLSQSPHLHARLLTEVTPC
jgi:hypothetical protein